MERKTGQEALKTLPFAEVVYPQSKALDILTGRTFKAVRANLNMCINGLLEGDVNHEEYISRVRRASENVEEVFLPGGFSLGTEQLQELYVEYEGVPYCRVVDFFTHEEMGAIFEEQSCPRNPGLVVMGCLLDLVDIVRDDIASYSERVAVVSESLRDAKVSPALMGRIIKDSYNFKGTSNLPFDFLTGRAEVTRFAEVYVKTLNQEEANEYCAELYLGVKSFSLS